MLKFSRNGAVGFIVWLDGSLKYTPSESAGKTGNTTNNRSEGIE
jgi:hypothetical protein